MKKILKFSKSYSNIFELKQDMFINNNLNLKNSIKIKKIYKKQPLRKTCKNCNSKKIKTFIISFQIPYKICEICGHLNGAYKDTNAFAKYLYFNNNGENYSRDYIKNYDQRVKNIYLPKVEFLKKVIKRRINLIDLGCGAGHFVKALELKKIPAVGYDVSQDLCKIGNKKLKKNKIFSMEFNNVNQLFRIENQANTLSMIGVLEHLVEPDKIMKLFINSKIKYLYISVPLFSLSTFIENSFPKVFPRQLSGDHTHLYTEKSLKYFAKKYNLKIIGEYWFGTDMPDLMRSIINSGNILNKKIYSKELNSKFSKIIDELQSVLDKNKLCSEVHMVFENKNI